MRYRGTLGVLVLVAMMAVGSSGEDLPVEGIFGLSPLPQESVISVWVPLAENETVTGVRWYNNDGALPFPEVLAVAGDPGCPQVLDAAVVVAENVYGESIGWSELMLESAYASATPGLFLIFRLPLDGEFVEEGTGSGLGFYASSGESRCWVSTYEGEWDRVLPEYQMAVVPMTDASKGADAIVLGAPRFTGDREPEQEMPLPAVASLSASPNPFNPSTSIQFALPAASQVQVTVFDLRGRRVIELLNGPLAAGYHDIPWQGRDGRGRGVSSGAYFAVLEAGPLRMQCRLTLVK